MQPIRHSLTEAKRRGCEADRSFVSGTTESPIHVDLFSARIPTGGRAPIVLVHGGCHTGRCYVATPDGRSGWAPHFANSGRDAYVVDWPGHGRSPPVADLPRLSTRAIADSIRTLLEAVGPAALLVHSASGPMAWWIAEAAPTAVRAVLGVAPGAPANVLPVLPDDPAEVAKLGSDPGLGHPVYMPEDRPVVVDERFARTYWANAPRFPAAAFDAYLETIVPESARLFNERFNIGGRGLSIRDPETIAGIPKLILTGEHDPRHPRELDAATARFVGADFVWLPDRGMSGNGHMPMIEDNSDAVADLLVGWLAAKDV